MPEKFAEATGPLPEKLTVTVFDYNKLSFGGTPERRGKGREYALSLEEFANELDDIANNVREKDLSLCFVQGKSRYGGSCDWEAEHLDWIWFDCDAMGEWYVLQAALRAAGVSFVCQRSGGYTLEKPKWHFHIPIVRPHRPPSPPADVRSGSPEWKAFMVEFAAWKYRWRDEGLWITGLIEVLAELPPAGLDAAPATCTFQLCYPAQRRTEDAIAHKTVRFIAGALDWEKLLALTGYKLSDKAEDEINSVRRIKKVRVKKEKVSKAATGEETVETIEEEVFEIDDDDDRNAEEVDVWVRAFKAAGLYDRLSGKVHAVICPWESEHSNPRTPGSTSTAILSTGTFKCKHGHCDGRNNRDVYEVLPDAAKAIITESRETKGVERVRARLKEHETSNAEMTTLDGVYERVKTICEEWKPGDLDVVIAPPGAGKNRSVNMHLPGRVVGAVIAPDHRLAATHQKNLKAITIAAVQHRKGVLAHKDDEGIPLCANIERAKQYQANGGIVGDFCKVCPYNRGCPALKAASKDNDARFIVTVQQLAETSRESMARHHNVEPRDILLIYDENVKLYDIHKVSVDDMKIALRVLDEDAGRADAKREFERFPMGDVRALLEILIESEAGTIGLPGAIEKATRWRQIPTVTRGSGAPLQRALSNIVCEYFQEPVGPTLGIRSLHLDSKNAKRRELRPPTIAGRDMSPDFFTTVRAIKAINDLLRELNVRGENAIEWISGELTVRHVTDAAKDLEMYGGIYLDATAKEFEILAINPNAKFTRLDVPDRSKSERTLMYRGKATKGHLCPDNVPNWKEVRAIFKVALAHLKPLGLPRVLFATHKEIIKGLQTPVDPIAIEIVGRLNAACPRWDTTYYGQNRGLNDWEAWEGCVTLGDPIENIGTARADYRAAMDRMGKPYTDMNDDLRAVVEGNLGQTHGRLRDPARTTPCFHLHIGQYVPSGWREGNTTPVAGAGAGRKKGERDKGFKQLVNSKGGQSEVTRAIGVPKSSLSLYCAGKRPAPEELIARVRALPDVANRRITFAEALDEAIEEAS